MSTQNQEILSTLETLQENIKEMQQVQELLSEKVEKLERKLEEVQTPGQYLWKIHNFSLEMEKKSILISDNFYTHTFGYKIRMEMYPNGNGDGKNSHVSIYYRIVSGKYDDIVNWPFKKGITAKLLDLNEDSQSKSHEEKTFYHDPQDSKKHAFEKPRFGEVNLLNCGTETFISHQKLSESTYLKDDTIYIFVNVI